VTDRYVTIHGHFYQPPRENPWLEAIEAQESAYPYHDWNERVNDESYAPNAASRILDEDGRISQIVNNYERISFNFGPTLLAWMETADPETYQAILEADRRSQARFSGHGSALAQVYNHMIMPLANLRDRQTLIAWGLHDFQARFGRSAEGMWLPETAVDLASLELLAEAGLRFTILAPHQAGRVRKLGDKNWRQVEGGGIDPSRPYLIELPSGRTLTIFFYDGRVSRAVAFEGLLSHGETLADRLADAFSEQRTWPQLVHIATDGETYGHHHRYGDMALAFALEYLEREGIARLTNYGEHLERFPPTHEVQIKEETSWSCAHGIERWRSDCGCNSGGHPGWQQAWRGPLREALDGLRDAVAGPFEEMGRGYLADPWQARHDYIQVVLDRTPENVDRFLAEHGNSSLEPADRVTCLKLLELQRHAMLMYASCGWFFDDISGIETVQVLRYAGRVVQLGQELFKLDLEGPFLARLSQAPSNLPDMGDGRVVYQRHVKPAIVNLQQVGAHYAILSLFEQQASEARPYAYEVTFSDVQLVSIGRARLSAGQLAVLSTVTGEAADLVFAVLHFGDHNLTAGVRPAGDNRFVEAFLEPALAQAARGELPETLRLVDQYFGEQLFSLRSLFRDEQQQVVDLILRQSLDEAEQGYSRIHRDNAALMRYVSELGIPQPRAFEVAAAFVLQRQLERALQEAEIDVQQVASFVTEAGEEGVPLDAPGLPFAFSQALEKQAEALSADPLNQEKLVRLLGLVQLSVQLPFQINLWQTQNLVYRLVEGQYPPQALRAQDGDPEAGAWTETFGWLAAELWLRLPEPQAAQ
jgi:alpha-amylase/alpha-mannosidase (GH57 family)